MNFLTNHLDTDASIFDRMSVNAYLPKSQETPVYNYSLTVSHIDYDTNKFVFISSLNPTNVPFSINQDALLLVANDLFANATAMTSIEQEILSKTFYRLSKKQATLKGRR